MIKITIPSNLTVLAYVTIKQYILEGRLVFREWSAVLLATGWFS